jgi:hypothetical protein
MRDWPLLVALVVVLLLRAPFVRHAAVRLARRVLAWGQVRAAAAERMDPEAEELWLASRRQRLSAAADRVRRIVATDEWMTATRQIANRIALADLLDELRRLPEPGVIGTASSVDPGLVAGRTYTEYALVPGQSTGRVVEVLDLRGW